jgi:hypothetical protein
MTRDRVRGISAALSLAVGLFFAPIVPAAPADGGGGDSFWTAPLRAVSWVLQAVAGTVGQDGGGQAASAPADGPGTDLGPDMDPNG